MIFLSRAEDAEDAEMGVDCSATINADQCEIQRDAADCVSSTTISNFHFKLQTSCFKLPTSLARAEDAEDAVSSFDIRAPIRAAQCEIQRDAADCVSSTTISNFHFKLQTSCFLLHSGACQTSKPCSARILLPMATAALINTRFLMMYCPSRVNTTGKCDQTK